MFLHAISYAHEIMKTCIDRGDIVIDGTCGNGNDTLFLSKLVGNEGRVFAFDIQEQAIQRTDELLHKEKRTNVTLVHDSHSNVSQYLANNIGPLAGAIFNLGYLPGSDKTIITQADSTILAVDSIAKKMKIGGVICLVVYHGHPGGKTEKEELIHHLSSYNQEYFNVIRYGFINQKNTPPFVLAIQKKG